MRIPVDPNDVPVSSAVGAVRLDPAALGNQAGAMRQASQQLNVLAADMLENGRQQEERRARLQAADLVAGMRGDWTSRMAQAQADPPADPTGFAADLLGRYDEDAKARIEAAPEAVRPLLSERSAQLRAELQTRAIGFEAVRQTEAQRETIQRVVNSHANTLRTDDMQMVGIRAEVRDAVMASNLRDKDGALREADRQLAISMMQGLNERNPERAAKLLADGTYDEVLRPADKNALVNDAQANLRRAENERKAAEAERRRQWEHGLVVRRAALSTALKDDDVRLADGFAPQIRDADIRSAFADMPEEGERRIQHRALLSETAEVRKNLRSANKEEEAAILERFKPKANEPDYAARRQRYDLLLADQRDKAAALAKDPAGYVAALSPELAASRKAAFSEPGKMAGYLAASLEMQDRLGVPKSRQSPLSSADASYLVERFAAADTPQAKLDVLLPVTAGLDDDALARRSVAALRDAKLPDAAVYALDVARDPARRNTARQLLAELSVKADKVTLSSVDDKEIGLKAAQAYEDGLGAVMMSAYRLTGNSAYRDRFSADQKAVEHVTRMRLGTTADPSTGAYRDLFGHVATLNSPDLAHVWFDAAAAGPADVERGLRALRDTAAQTIRAEGEKLVAAELAAMADKSAGERAAHEKLRLRQIDAAALDFRRRGAWVNQGGGYVAILPGTGAAVGSPVSLPDILAAAKSDRARRAAIDAAAQDAWVVAAAPAHEAWVAAAAPGGGEVP